MVNSLQTAPTGHRDGVHQLASSTYPSIPTAPSKHTEDTDSHNSMTLLGHLQGHGGSTLQHSSAASIQVTQGWEHLISVRNSTVSSTLRLHPQNDTGLWEQAAKAHGTRSVVCSGDATSLIRRTVKKNHLHKCAREQGFLPRTGYKLRINKTTDQHRNF